MSSGSRDSQETRAQRAKLVGELARELRQLNGLSASFVRAAAARIGVTVTDMQVIESLTIRGPMTAGQLAELTGLTTGAITGMINRLEEAGMIRRERDPEDARRVIVRLPPDSDQIRGIGPTFDAIGKAWEEQVAQYDDEQIALLIDFLKRTNAVTWQEIQWLREAPEGAKEVYSAPAEEVTSGQLVVAGAPLLTLRVSSDISALYQARFQGPTPEVKAKDGTVTIRYPRRMWLMRGGSQTAAEVMLNAHIPWRISIQGSMSQFTAELGGLDLARLEVNGAMSMVQVELPTPTGVVPVRISGGASEIIVRRPAGVPARVHLKGWVSTFLFDDETFSAVGNNVRLQSKGYDATDQRYDIEVASSASMVTITSA